MQREWMADIEGLRIEIDDGMVTIRKMDDDTLVASLAPDVAMQLGDAVETGAERLLEMRRRAVDAAEKVRAVTKGPVPR